MIATLRARITALSLPGQITAPSKFTAPLPETFTAPNKFTALTGPTNSRPPPHVGTIHGPRQIPAPPAGTIQRPTDSRHPGRDKFTDQKKTAIHFPYTLSQPLFFNHSYLRLVLLSVIVRHLALSHLAPCFLAPSSPSSPHPKHLFLLFSSSRVVFFSSLVSLLRLCTFFHLRVFCAASFLSLPPSALRLVRHSPAPWSLVLAPCTLFFLPSPPCPLPNLSLYPCLLLVLVSSCSFCFCLFCSLSLVLAEGCCSIEYRHEDV